MIPLNELAHLDKARWNRTEGDVGSVLPFVMDLLGDLDMGLCSLLSPGFIFLQNLGCLGAKANLHLLG